MALMLNLDGVALFLPRCHPKALAPLNPLMELNAMDQSKMNVRVLVVEGFVIVVSILIAFALDAGWDGYQKGLTEQAHLAALRADFTQTRDHLDGAIKDQQRIIDIARQLKLAESDTAVRPTGAALDSMLFWLLALPGFKPVSGAHEALISSGHLSLIRDRDLRAALATWSNYVESVEATNRWAEDGWNLINAPFLMKEMSLTQIVPDGILEELSVSSHPRNHTALFDDPYFHNLVTLRWLAAVDIIRSLQWMRKDVDLILARLGP